jgi:hypothetical protein
LTALLQVMTQPGIDEGVALAAAIQFKNSVCQGWIQREGYDRIWTEDQKAPVREILIEVGRSCPLVWLSREPLVQYRPVLQAAMHTKSIPVIIALGLPIAVIVNEDFPVQLESLRCFSLPCFCTQGCLFASGPLAKPHSLLAKQLDFG